MKFLLISPGMLDDAGCLVKLQKEFFPGLTLPYLASLLPGRDEVRIIIDGVEEVDFDEPADVVMLTAMTSRAERAYQIAAGFRRRGVKVIIGGIHATLFPSEAREQVDAVVVGEAEGVMGDLLADLAAGALKPRYQSDRLSDLTGLPPPRYDLINHRHYLMQADPVQVFRGCPHRCRYCSVHLVQGHRLRRRPLSEVLEDIKRTRRFIIFADDNLMADREYARELFLAMRPLGKFWGAQSDISIAGDPELLGLARSAGCALLYIGIESLDRSTLLSMNKSVNTRMDLGLALDRVRATGIAVCASMIVGFDTDTAATMEEMIGFLEEHQVPVLYLFILTALPGTALREELEKEGRLLSRPWRYFDGKSATFTPQTMTAPDLEKLYWQTNERFYSFRSMARRILWPPHFVPAVYNLLSRKNLKSRLHPLMGGAWNIPLAAEVMDWVLESPLVRRLIAPLDHARATRTAKNAGAETPPG